MPGETLTSQKIAEIFEFGNTERIEEFFSKWNFSNSNSSRFPMELAAKNELGDEIAKFIMRDELTAILLETIRLLSRDKDGLEGFLNVDLCNKVIFFSGLSQREDAPTKYHVSALMEAQKCLINTLYQSARMRDVFFANPIHADNLRFYLSEFSDQKRRVSEFAWIKEMNAVQASEIWFFFHRIGFITTALNKELEKKWAQIPEFIDELLIAVEICLGKTTVPVQDINRANEALKTFFNVYCHFHTDVVNIDEAHSKKVTRILRDVICSDTLGDDLIMSAIHAVSVPPLPITLSVWCQDPENPQNEEEDDVIDLVREYKDMRMTEAVLMALDRQLKVAVHVLNTTPPNQVPTEANTITDLCGPFFQALARLCTDSKYARRYCRIRVLPPLVADEVKKRPEEHDSLRGRIVRIMMLPSATKDVASEFLFIICKRSVSRMIKYVGFGHSAGHLANMGLLGQINQPKHASDSEDSETEDYIKVRDNVNPVTGAMYPPDHGSALAGMSDAQKEFEAMKLVEAMNKMMDAGIVKPGTIGEDGKVREVSHVLELIKDAPETKSDDSDSE